MPCLCSMTSAFFREPHKSSRSKTADVEFFCACILCCYKRCSLWMVLRWCPGTLRGVFFHLDMSFSQVHLFICLHTDITSHSESIGFNRLGNDWLFSTTFNFTLCFTFKNCLSLPCLCHSFQHNLTCLNLQGFFYFDILY